MICFCLVKALTYFPSWKVPYDVSKQVLVKNVLSKFKF